MKLSGGRIKVVLILLALLSVSSSQVSALSLSFQPETILQGNPLMITVEGTNNLSGIQAITFDSQKLKGFVYEDKPRALYGIDLKKKPGTYKVAVVFNDGTILTQDIIVVAREKIEAPLGVPTKLGGDTKKSEKKLVDTLALENKSLSNLYTNPKSLWKKPFVYPLNTPIVTDDYGYTRQTGSYTISHKGTDFKASTGTKVTAMNRGIIRVSKRYRDYGNTVVIDHGLGVMTFYMHLSKLKVKTGQLVEQGQTIGLSGATGYAESPHLHLTVRINSTSIDPIVFMGLFK